MWTKERIDGIVRHILGAAGGFLAGSGFAEMLTPDTIAAIAGVIASVTAAFFSATAPEKKPE